MCKPQAAGPASGGLGVRCCCSGAVVSAVEFAERFLDPRRHGGGFSQGSQVPAAGTSRTEPGRPAQAPWTTAGGPCPLAIPASGYCPAHLPSVNTRHVGLDPSVPCRGHLGTRLGDGQSSEAGCVRCAPPPPPVTSSSRRPASDACGRCDRGSVFLKWLQLLAWDLWFM